MPVSSSRKSALRKAARSRIVIEHIQVGRIVKGQIKVGNKTYGSLNIEIFVYKKGSVPVNLRQYAIVVVYGSD